MTQENALDVNELEGVISEAAAVEAEAVTDEQPESESQIPTAKALEPLIGVSFKVLAPNWNVQPVEVEALAESYGEAIDYYYPDLNEGLPPWLTPLVVTAAIIGPRLNTPRVKPDEREIEGEQVTDDAQG